MSQSKIGNIQITSWIIKYLKNCLTDNSIEIGDNTSFASLGLDSVKQVEMIAALEDWLQQRIEPTLAYDYPTIASLSQKLSDDLTHSAA
jgi:acyl carrier protein